MGYCKETFTSQEFRVLLDETVHLNSEEVIDSMVKRHGCPFKRLMSQSISYNKPLECHS